LKHETLQINILKTNDVIHMSYYMNLRCFNATIKYTYTFALTSDPSDALVITGIHEQYGGPVHLFIGTGHSLWGITIMPFIEVYNIDSDLYELKCHSIFKSVSHTEASWRRTFGHLIQTASAESRFFPEDLRRRSIDPTISGQNPSSFETLFPLGYNDLQTKVMKDVPSSS
jgi:hypothetical protein